MICRSPSFAGSLDTAFYFCFTARPPPFSFPIFITSPLPHLRCIRPPKNASFLRGIHHAVALPPPANYPDCFWHTVICSPPPPTPLLSPGWHLD